MADVKEVRMMELVGDLEFITELLDTFLIECPIEFDGNVDIGQQIIRQPDIAETSLSELFLQLVMLGNDITFLKCHASLLDITAKLFPIWGNRCHDGLGCRVGVLGHPDVYTCSDDKQ